jgi:putative membrane protein
MIVVGVLLIAVAIVFHVYAFVLESLRWTAPKTRTLFGTTPQQAEQTRQLALNQGFYNLFLAVGALVGILLVLGGQRTVGAAVAATCGLVMTGAGLVLMAFDRRKVRIGMLQAAPPAVGVATLLIGLAGA